MDAWYRAYHYRMLVERVGGTRRQAALLYAEKARSSCRRIAASQTRYQDDLAALEAYFATLDGDKDAALSAAHRVDIDAADVENLYLTVSALEVGGDKEVAADLRRKIRAQPPSLALAIVLKWMDRDAQPKATTFSPRNPKVH